VASLVGSVVDSLVGPVVGLLKVGIATVGTRTVVVGLPGLLVGAFVACAGVLVAWVVGPPPPELLKKRKKPPPPRSAITISPITPHTQKGVPFLAVLTLYCWVPACGG